MNQKKFSKLLSKGESETIEFKISFDKETTETLTAFTNTKGGSVIIGVTDAGKLQGTQLGKESIPQWLNKIKVNTFPSIIPDVSKITIDSKTVVILSVAEFPVKPVSCKGKYLKRIQNSNHQMSINEISNLHLKTYQTSWDYYNDTRHRLDDISLVKVNDFIELSSNIRPYPILDDPMTVLKKFELLKGQAITNGCYLLFASEDSFATTIEVGRFSGETVIKDSVTIRSDLFNEVENVLRFILKHLDKAYIITGKTQREERWDYPLQALREIVVNMVVHRDYMDSNDSIVKTFDDRIEFFNPGRLMEGLSVDRLLRGNYTSAIRNKQVATIFKEAGIIEKYGSGIKRILEALRALGLPDPIFEEIQHGFRVTVFKTTQKTKTRDQVIEVLRESPEMTRDELALMLGKSPNTIKEHIARLKAEGKLVRIGSDRDGYWKVIDF